MNDTERTAAFELAEQTKRETEIGAIRDWFDFIDREREARATWERGEND